jgi:hypothetical protein
MFLKAYIAQSKPELNEAGFKKYGHVLKSILQKIIEDEQTAEFQDIKSSVQKVDMNINHRYKPIAYPDQKAIETIDSMLKSCHFISEKILSKVRGWRQRSPKSMVQIRLLPGFSKIPSGLNLLSGFRLWLLWS